MAGFENSDINTFIDTFISVEQIDYEYYDKNLLFAEIEAERAAAKAAAAEAEIEANTKADAKAEAAKEAAAEAAAEAATALSKSKETLSEEAAAAEAKEEVKRAEAISAAKAPPEMTPEAAAAKYPLQNDYETYISEIDSINYSINILLLSTLANTQQQQQPRSDPQQKHFNIIKEEIKKLNFDLRCQINKCNVVGQHDSKRGGYVDCRTKIKILIKLCMFLILIWFIYDYTKMRLMFEGYYMIRSGYCFSFKEAMWSAIGLDNQVCTQYRVFVMSIFNLTIIDYLRYCLTSSSVAVIFYKLNNYIDYTLDRGLDLIGYEGNFNANNNVHLLLQDTHPVAQSGGFPKLSRKISKTKKIRKKRKKGYKKTKNKKKRKSRLI